MIDNIINSLSVAYGKIHGGSKKPSISTVKMTEEEITQRTLELFFLGTDTTVSLRDRNLSARQKIGRYLIPSHGDVFSLVEKLMPHSARGSDNHVIFPPPRITLQPFGAYVPAVEKIERVMRPTAWTLLFKKAVHVQLHAAEIAVTANFSSSRNEPIYDVSFCFHSKDDHCTCFPNSVATLSAVSTHNAILARFQNAGCYTEKTKFVE